MVVALFLAGILLTTTLHFFQEYAKTQTKLRVAKENVLRRSFLQLRLNQLFTKASLLEKEEVGSSPEFYSENEALIFDFENGIDFEPAFSGPLIAKLYVSKNELLLEFQAKNGATRKEVLLPNIKSVAFKFFDQDEGNWVNLWSKEKTMTPPIITLKIQEKKVNEALDFSFFFPSETPITYKKA